MKGIIGMKQNRILIGLTGNIASGKSTVSRYLVKKGYYVIDVDIVAREVVEIGSEGLEKLEKVFGTEIINKNGELDRKKLGSIVFSNTDELHKINNILHPMIRKRIISSIEECKEKIVFIDAALIYETGLDKIVDFVWFVEVSEEDQIERLISRDKCTVEDADKRIQSQGNQNEKCERADVIINNNSSINELFKQIDAIIISMGLDKIKP